jgi:hypothetical protein
MSETGLFLTFAAVIVLVFLIGPVHHQWRRQNQAS